MIDRLLEAVIVLFWLGGVGGSEDSRRFCLQTELKLACVCM